MSLKLPKNPLILPKKNNHRREKSYVQLHRERFLQSLKTYGWHHQIWECKSESTVNVSEKQKMDAFDDGFGGEGEVEVDPAAEFLAKEQEELGDIGEFP